MCPRFAPNDIAYGCSSNIVDARQFNILPAAGCVLLTKDGLRPSCKACHNSQAVEYRQANKDAIAAREKIRNQQEPRRQKARRYFLANKEKLAERAREYRQRNQDKVRARDKERSVRDRDKRNTYYSAYYRKNRGNRIEWQRDYYRLNKAAVMKGGRLRSQRRRARQHALPNNFTQADWLFALDHFGGCCAVCGRPPGLWHQITIDHWIPITSPNCPGHIPGNVVPMCFGIEGCNNSKHDRDPQEWIMAKFGERRGREILAKVQEFFSRVRVT